MTKEQLKEGNILTDKIRCLERSKEGLAKTIKNLELENALNPLFAHVRFDRSECEVNNDRLVSFLNDELKEVVSEISKLKQELKEL